MKIVFCSGTPLAGVSELMTRMVNQYLAPEHEARCVSRGTGLHANWYRRAGVSVPHTCIRQKKSVWPVLDWADVIHCMANVSARTMGRLDLLKKKRWVFQWHGAQIWPFRRVWEKEDYKYVRWIHIGQGWTRQDFFKGFRYTIIPNLISIDDEIHMPIPWEDRKARVGFAPSTLKRGQVNQKGVAEVTKAAGEAGVKLDMIHGKSFELCMRKKGVAKLGVDEVVSKLYHRSGLEFLAQGVPCICSYDDFTVDCLEQAVGTRDMPFINASPRSLGKVIRAHFDMPDSDLYTLSCAARQWMETHYHPKKLLERYLAVYQ